MSEDIKFSVLIPVYNAEMYLQECIESVLMQYYKNFEIILVDDGSNDCSGDICDNYAQKYNFIKVIHQENKGQYAAREVALSNANGEFCIYLDSDDYWDENLLSEVKKEIDRSQCDIVIFDRRDIYEDGNVEIKLPFKNRTIFGGENKQILYKMLIEGVSLHNLVLKAFRKTIAIKKYERTRFCGTCYGEDGFKSAFLIINSDKITYLPICLYNYRRGVGVTSVIVPDFIEKITYYQIQMWKLFEYYNIDIEGYKKKAMIFYMNSIPRGIIYSYAKSPDLFKKSFERVKISTFYIDSKVYAYSKLGIIEKFVIWCAEKEKYFLIKFVKSISDIRNKLKKGRKLGII